MTINKIGILFNKLVKNAKKNYLKVIKREEIIKIKQKPITW